MTLTEEEKKQMPATRQRTSLLAVGCNLVLSEDKPEQPARVERSGPYPVKLVHTRSESRVTAADSASAAANMFELSVLSEVCEVERAKLCPAPEQETAGVSVATVPPDPAPSFNPLPKRPVLN